MAMKVTIRIEDEEIDLYRVQTFDKFTYSEEYDVEDSKKLVVNFRGTPASTNMKEVDGRKDDFFSSKLMMNRLASVIIDEIVNRLSK